MTSFSNRSPLICPRLLFFAVALFIVSFSSIAHADWQDTLKTAKGQIIYFNAWGGSAGINDYIQWAGKQVKNKYGVTVKHVKINDAADVVSRILAEKTAGKNSKGSVDLIWINGENFKKMKTAGLMQKPWTNTLPNYALIDEASNKALVYDFTTPVDNLEAPWGQAQLVFMYDTKRLKTPPSSMAEFARVAKANPQRLAYPAPPEFHGTTFLKQALIESIEDSSVLGKPLVQADFSKHSRPLWDYLDALHPYLWQKGKNFPKGIAEMKQMLNDGELIISISFNPNDASNAIANDELPDTVRTYVHTKGTIGNVHFVAIPFNSSNTAGAKVFANFLMSPQAQARKAAVAIWGDPTVLSMARLSAADKRLFDELPKGVATLSPKALGNVLPEPHPSWVRAIEEEWQKRYH